MTSGGERLPFSIFSRCKEWQSFSPGLERVAFVLKELGNPHLSYPHVVVGGTNGKGTVSYNLALNGPKPCGLLLSPHVQNIRERITLAGEWISDDVWEAACLRILEAVPNPDLSYFEWLLVLAVVMFEMEGCAFALFEVGLGGRIDAVNALEPNVSVLTNVSLDHQAILGENVEQIALEKIEIARKGKPFLYPMVLNQYHSIRTRLEQMGCLGKPFQVSQGFLGNSEIIAHCLEELDWQGKVTLQHLSGRREVLRDGLYLDGAHNEAGWLDMVDWIKKLSPPLNILCSLSLGRDPLVFLNAIRPVTRKVYVWDVSYEKVLALDTWPENVEIIKDTDIPHLLEESLLVCGSLYMTGLFKNLMEKIGFI